ncbi:ribokinase [Spirosoma aureum]|uniref:Ribokinase n=1 Tax=Spirosoma aureum TaxID=2692134 RepID=A0A6G9ATY3_9BACT|nr:ribokinase [Spirosoma aureum]QIP15947.1 ribokinase [Spirosoma aureum]
MPSQILVVGSSNTDMVVKAEKLPAPGETVIGGTFLMNPGGKGANQAVAAARLVDSSAGKSVTFVAKVGNDIFGRQALSGFEREGINTSYVLTDADYPSGVALINVDASGENCITVAPGSNANLQPGETEAALQAAEADALVLLQLEIPLPTVEYVIREAARRGCRVILNPAPAQPLPADLFPHLFLITPNETEAELLTGIRVTDSATAEQAAWKLRDMGVKNVVITLGSKGAYLYEQQGQVIEAPPVKAVDTTAAGDCFNGALAVALSEGKPLPDAVAFACKAASLSVTRMGAQASVPYRHEMESTVPSRQ